MNTLGKYLTRIVALTFFVSGLSGCVAGMDSDSVDQIIADNPPIVGGPPADDPPADDPPVTGTGGSSVTLSWTPPTENADNSPLRDLAGYKFYYGLSDGDYPNSIYINNAGLSSYTVSNLPANTYYFVVTAVNEGGAESAFSNATVWVSQ